MVIVGILLGYDVISVDGFNSQDDQLEVLQDALQSVCIFVVTEFFFIKTHGSESCGQYSRKQMPQ